MAFSNAGRYGPENVVAVATGIPIPGASTTVYLRGTTTKATLYTDRTKATTAANPVLADSYGNLTFFADPGEYDLLISGRTLPVTVPLDPGEVDAEASSGAQVAAHNVFTGNNTFSGTSTFSGDTVHSGALEIPSSTEAALGTATAGRIKRVSDGTRGLWMGQGAQWFSLSGNVVNVKEFGAKGDGTTDDTTAIQAAIDAIPANAAGTTLLFPIGKYKVTSTLNFSGNKWGWRLQGSGGMRFRFADGTEAVGGSVIQAGTASMTVMKFLNVGLGGPIIEGLHFEEATLAKTANFLVLENTSNWTVRNCSFQWGAQAILIDARNDDSSWGKIDQCFFYQNTLSVKSTNDGSVQTPSFLMMGGRCDVPASGTGIHIAALCHGSRIIGSKFDVGSGGTGIKINGAAINTKIVGCYLEGSGASTTYINVGNADGVGRARATEIIGVFVAVNGATGGTGILLQGTSGIKVKQVVIHGGQMRNLTTGVSVDNATNNSIIGLTSHLCTTGIALSAAAADNIIIAPNGEGNGTNISNSGTGTLVLADGVSLDTTYPDGADFILGTATGTKWGTAAGQKQAWWGATPIVQPAALADTSGATLAALETEVNTLKAKLRALGLMAT